MPADVSDPITPTMAEALGLAYEHGGELVRFQGGFWSYRGNPNWPPAPWFGAPTVNGLVARERMRWTEHKAGRVHSFPVAAAVVDEPAE